MGNHELELELAANVVGIMEKADAGELDAAAAERGVTPRQLVAAAVVEMCRQAFTGE